MHVRHILTVGRSAFMVDVGSLRDALDLFHAIEQDRIRSKSTLSAVTQVIPAARTVLVEYDAARVSHTDMVDALKNLDTTTQVRTTHRSVSIPVIYNGRDLAIVASILGKSPQALIEWHTGTPWQAAFGGFAPGFVYLTRLDGVGVPRRATPRIAVPRGAVGLAGTYSGIYPQKSSGGWQLIGTTEIPMWDVRRESPSTIQPGDLVLFRAVREHIITTDMPKQTSTRRSVKSEMDAMVHPVLQVERTGIMALFEDDGRHAAALGVAGSGAADRDSAHLANDLVGNPKNEPVIEITNGGAAFRALDDIVLAVTGARTSMEIRSNGPGHGSSQAITRQEAFLLRRNESLVVGVPTGGIRDYLAIQGGFMTETVLGSASTDTMSHLGPSPLMPGDVVDGASHDHHTVGNPLPWGRLPSKGATVILDVVLGPRDDWFTEKGISDLFAQRWTVTAQSNRVGLRLHGDGPLERRVHGELSSEGIVPGSLEVPSDGQPVLLLCDQPVTGGYPVIAVLTPQSRRLAGQLPAGVRIQFVPARDDTHDQKD